METPMDQFAEFSCVSCRRLKRKCSKDLPTCSLCSRVGRTCLYQPPSANADRFDTQIENGFGQHLNSDATASASSTAPTLMTGFQPLPPSTKSPLAHSFLDSVALRGEEPTLANSLLWQDLHPDAEPMPLEEAWITASRFFETTYDWLPIVSKIRLFRILSSDVSIASADIQILLFAMQLSMETSTESRHRLYRMMKTAILNLEQYASFSTNFLAAYALLALHELGQGIFPAAYITIGSLARIFYAIGFHDRRKATQILRIPDTWTEAEERRRIWWAVLIFDRYVHVGLRFRPLSTPNIPADELLPASDDDWDSGELSVNPLLVMSMEAVTSVSPFARACQAAHLLGRVCEHVNQHPTSFDADFHFQEALQISRALQALLTMLIQESEHSSSHQQKLFTARGLAYAALITLYDVHSCVEPSEIETVGGQRGLRIEVQQHAIEGFKQVTRDTCAFAEEIEQACVSGSLEKLPMVVLTALHAAAGTYAWYARETGAEKSLADLAHLRRVMGTLGAKWGVASQYLEILEGQEYSYDGGHCQ